MQSDATICSHLQSSAHTTDQAFGTDGLEVLELRFGVPVRPWRWEVYMSALPEALVEVKLIDTLGNLLPGGYTVCVAGASPSSISSP